MSLAAQIQNLNPSKKLVFVLRDCTTGNVLALTPIQYAVFQYAGGIPANAGWMTLEQKGVVVTSAAGIVVIPYSGPELVGATVYIAILEPNPAPVESLIWTTTVQP